MVSAIWTGVPSKAMRRTGASSPRVEVQPDCEQEERHPDLGQQLYLVHVPDRWAEGVRTDEDAGGDVAEDQGQPQPSGQDALPGGRPPG